MLVYAVCPDATNTTNNLQKHPVKYKPPVLQESNHKSKVLLKEDTGKLRLSHVLFPSVILC